jgi:hypothetical protein
VDYPNLAVKRNRLSKISFVYLRALRGSWLCPKPKPICAGLTEQLQFPQQFFLSKLEDQDMKSNRTLLLATLILVTMSSALAQQASKHVLSSDEVKKATPSEYFFRGQKAPVQLRNSVGFQLADGKMFLAALVDASGYSTAIQQKYQGLLITEVKLTVGGSALAPGEYGFGFTSDGKFVVMDVGNNDVLSESSQTEQALQHAVPLKLVEYGAGYKLYAGKKWIGIKAE